MPVIAFVGNKGGAGKTTLSLNLATCLARQCDTVVVDADPQGSAIQWREFAEDQNTIPVHEATEQLADQAKKLLEKYQYVVIDCPPSVHAPQTTTVLSFADFALIPVQPSPIDMWATVHIEDAVQRARNMNPALKALLIINQMESRSTLSKLVRDAFSEIGLPVASIALRRRAIFRTSALEGKTVFDMGRRGSDAVNEIEQLIQEVVGQ